MAEGPKLRRAILSRMRPERQERVLFVWEKAIEQTGGYFYSRLLLAVINGTGMYLVLRFNNVPFAAPLAIFEGIVSEFIPIVGTYIGGAAPILVAFLSSTSAGVWAVGYVVVYQQLENYFLSPRLTAKTMSLASGGRVRRGPDRRGARRAALRVPRAARCRRDPGLGRGVVPRLRRGRPGLGRYRDRDRRCGRGRPRGTTRKLPPMSQPLVGVIMGSRSDWEVMKHACDTLQELGVECETRVVSAHRTPDAATEYARTAAERGLRLLIAGAGGAAHLAGVMAGNTHLPVLGVPMQTSALGGMDSLLSTVQMPAGIPVGTLAIGKAGATNAALLAVAILALSDPDLSARLVAFREAQTSKILAHPDPSAD